MSAKVLYRIAAVLLILFAAGHTIGFLNFKPPTPQGVAVLEAMNTVQFQMGRGSFTYGKFYKGFGLFCTAYMLFLAYLSWHLGGWAATNPGAIGALGWAFCALQVAGTALSWIYFFTPPIVFSALLAAATGLAAWQAQRAAQAGAAR